MENNNHPMSNIIIHEDLLVQILSRLPKKSLHRFKAVSKEWHALISAPHRFPRLSSDSGFLLQTPLSRSSLVATFFRLRPHAAFPNSLLFLFRPNSNSLSVRSSPYPFLPPSPSPSQPPSFSIAASSNGFLLLLRSILFSTSSFHVFHPLSNLLLSLPPPPTNPTSAAVGFAAQGQKQQTHYDVVFFSLAPHPPGNPDLLFHIFSSPAGRWRKKVVRAFSSDLPASPAVFVRGCLHWLWPEHLLVFRLADDCHQIVELPKQHHHPLHGFSFTASTRSAFTWEAEGSLHYCEGSLHRLRIWVLLSDGWFYRSKRRGFGWELKHDILLRISDDIPNMDVCCSSSSSSSRCYLPCGFNDDFEILYLWEEGESALLALNLATCVMKEVWKCPPSVKFQDMFPFFFGGTDHSSLNNNATSFRA
ncbi:hypothetical protein ACLOJK_038024 [Asimina triloba]